MRRRSAPGAVDLTILRHSLAWHGSRVPTSFPATTDNQDPSFQPSERLDGDVSLSDDDSPRKEETSAPQKPLRAEELDGPVLSGAAPHREFGVLRVTVLEAQGLLAGDYDLLGRTTSSDAYCVLSLGRGRPVRTETVQNSLEPRWDASFDFLLGAWDPMLRLDVYDEDLAKKDDFLGFAQLPLGPIGTPGRPAKGWLPLSAPEGHDGAVGAVLLEIELLEVWWAPRFKACVAPAPEPEQPPPPFNIDEVYAPAMKILDLLWFRGGLVLLYFFLDLVYWKRPAHSLLALLLWNVAARFFLHHWPAGFCIFIALYMLAQRGGDLHDNGCKPQGTECGEPCVQEDGDAESHLGSFVQRSCCVLPGWLKDKCRGYQPLLRQIADASQLAHDVLNWRHPSSPHTAAALMAAAAFCEACSFSTVLVVVGSLTLLVLSPVMTWLCGLATYMRWVLAPGVLAVSPDCRREWLSTDYRPRSGSAPTDRPSERPAITQPSLQRNSTY